MTSTQQKHASPNNTSPFYIINMPKASRRKKAIKGLSRVCYARVLEHFQRGDDSSVESDFDDEDSIEDDLDSAFATRLQDVCNSRYLYRGPYRRSGLKKQIIEDDLDDEHHEGHRPWLTPEEFKQKYRVDRESFQIIYDLIKDHRVFKKKGPKGRPQTDVKIQLCVFLHFSWYGR